VWTSECAHEYEQRLHVVRAPQPCDLPSSVWCHLLRAARFLDRSSAAVALHGAIASSATALQPCAAERLVSLPGTVWF
jgi:hypothetical protein